MSNVIRDGNWSLPRASSSQLLNLFQIIRASHLPSVASLDEIVWMGSENGVFSMKEAMASYTSSPPPVWHDLIWFKGKVPQFSVLSCVLCNSSIEDCNHIFIDFPFSATIWNAICMKFEVTAPRCSTIANQITQLLQACDHSRGDNLVLAKLCFPTFLAFI